jgi:AraC-like DNA-binding protein
MKSLVSVCIFALLFLYQYANVSGSPVTNAKITIATNDTSEASLKKYNRLFLSAFDQGYNFKAREYARKALIISIKRGNVHEVAMAYSNLAIINTRMGDYEKANENNFTALRIFKQLNDSLHVARCNLSIGTVFIKLKEYKKALKYINVAADAFYQLNDQRGYSICLSNTGSIFMEMSDYKKALPIFFEAAGIDEKNNDPGGTSSNFANIGLVYLNLSNYTAAATYFKKALAINKAMGNISSIANVYLNYSKLMLQTGKKDSALFYCDESLKKYHEAGQMDEEANVYSQYASIFEATGNFNSAYKYFIKSTELRDSLMDIEKAARISMLEEKYINEKLSKDILALEYKTALQETKIENQNRLSITWLVGMIFSIIAVIIIVIQLRRKNNAYKFIVSKNLALLQKEQELHGVKSEIEELSIDEKTRLNISVDEKIKLLKKLRSALQNDKIYTRTDLTIEKLSRKLGSNRTYLSQLINDEYQKSYSELINEYRIKEAMSMLSDQVLSQRYSIEAIAKEAGFNNISTFNSLFRKYVGITPSIFRKSANLQ